MIYIYVCVCVYIYKQATHICYIEVLGTEVEPILQHLHCYGHPLQHKQERYITFQVVCHHHKNVEDLL